MKNTNKNEPLIDFYGSYMDTLGATFDRKKFPRLLMAHPDEKYQIVNGVHFVWPKGGRSQVLDISYSGLVISSSGFLDKVKLMDFFEAHLILPTSDQTHIPISVRVVKKTAQTIGFRIDTVSPEGRIKIEQGLKDQLVSQGIRPMSSDYLQASIRCDEWFHGPFDTNLLTWFDGAQVKRMIIEYDNSVLIYQDGKYQVARTASACDESAGYGAPFLAKDFGQQKLSLGNGWLERLGKVLSVSLAKGSKTEVFLSKYISQEKSNRE